MPGRGYTGVALTGGHIMRTKAPTILLTTTALALGACTTSLQTRLDNVKPTETVDAATGVVTGQNKALRGVTYALPMRQYDIEVKRRLSMCNAPVEVTSAGNVIALGAKYIMPALAFELSAIATGSLIEGERYLIDYEALSSASKITDFKIEYHDGTTLLKSVNASADDQTGEIIGKTVGAGLAVAGLVFPVSAAVAAPLAGTTMALSIKSDDAARNFFVAALPLSSPEVDLIQILALSSKRVPAIDCSDDSAAKIRQRDAANAEIKRLTTGKVDIEWGQLGVAPGGAPKPAMPPADATLTGITEKLSLLLPYIGIKPQPASISSDLQWLLQWQALIMAKIRSETAKRDKIDADLGFKKTEKWPLLANDRMAPEIAKVDAVDSLPLVTVAPALIVDPVKVADNLIAARAALPGLRAVYPDFVNLFLRPDDTRRTDLRTPAIECYGDTASAQLCLDRLLAVSATLDRDATQDGKTALDTLAADTGSRDANGRPEWEKARNKILFTPVPVYTAQSSNGLFIRPPGSGTLKVCAGAPADKNKLSAYCQNGLLNKQTTDLMPQLGQLRFLPLVNKPFANNGLSVALAKDGRPLSFGYASKRAMAASFATSVGDVATQIRTFKDAQAKRQTDANAAKIAELKYQIDLFEQSKKVDDLGKPPAAQSAEEKKAEIDTQQASYAKAELVRLITEQCLLRARAYPDTPTACPVD